MSSIQIKKISLSDFTIGGKSIEDLWDKFGTTYGKILYDYYQTYDTAVFDRNRSIIQDLIRIESDQVFFYKLEKILLLYRYWFKEHRWKDPLVAIQFGKQLYVHPGIDRYAVLVNQGIQEYDFIYIPYEEITLDNLNLFKKLYGSNRVEIKTSPRGINSIHHFDNSEIDYSRKLCHKWLESGEPFLDYCYKSVQPGYFRQQQIKKLIKK